MDRQTTISDRNVQSEPHTDNELVSDISNDQQTPGIPSGCNDSIDQESCSTVMVSSSVVTSPLPEAILEFQRAIALMDQCKAELRWDDLDAAISMFRDVLGRRPATHPLHVTTMRHFALAYTIKLFYTKQITGMNDILSFYNNTLDDDMNYSTSPFAHGNDSDSEDDKILEMAKTRVKEFNRAITVSTINEIITLLQTFSATLPLDEPEMKLQSFTNLAEALYSRFRHSGKIPDLESAELCLRDALEYCEGKPTLARAPIFLQAVTMYATKWELLARRRAKISGILQSGGVSDADKNVTRNDSLQREYDSAKESQQYFAKTMQLLYMRALERPNVYGDDLDERISFYKTALPHHAAFADVLLVRLGFTLFTRFEQKGDRDDLEEAIMHLGQALKLQPSGHRGRATSLANLGGMFLKRYETAGQPDERDVTDAIAMLREALTLLPPFRPERPICLNNLAAALLFQCDNTGSTDEINEAVELNKEALELVSDSPQQHVQLAYLASSLEHREFRLGLNPEDLDDAIDLRRNVLQRRPLVANSHCDLGLALFSRYVRKNREDDLEEAISSLQNGLNILPPSHVNRHKFNMYLANMLYLNGKLNEATEMQNQTLRNLVEPSKRADVLHCMGDYLLRKSVKDGNNIGLDKAIPLYREALDLRPPPNPYRLNTINNLAVTMFEVDQTKYNEALSLIEDNLQLEPQGHHARPNSYALLGELHSCASWLSHGDNLKLDHLEKAMAYYAKSLNLPGQPDADRFKTAKKWIAWADQHRHSSALDAYDAALHHLPRLASLGSRIESRLKMLITDSDGLARQAARCAIRNDKFEKAVEYLESGRAVLWSQILKLRSPVDALQIKAPELAQKLRDAAAELERGSHYRTAFDDFVGNEKKILLEREEVHYTRLNDAREKYIDEVRRTVEGFADFLRPRSLKALQVAAAAYPVVFLIANSDVDASACLIMTATGPPHHIPLPKLPAEELRQLARMINTDVPSEAQSQSRSVMDDPFVLKLPIKDPTSQPYKRSPGEYTFPDEPLSDESFRFVLTTLWNEVVKPVIEHLEIEKMEEGNVPLQRLLWCPTGLFTFLPIHAAGDYTDSGTLIEDASQYIVSSYTPTIEVLLSQDEPSNTGPAGEKFEMLAVIDSQGLRSAPVELYEISKQVPKECLVALGASHGGPATVERVVAHLQTASVAHFACHGMQDTKDPLQSALQVCAGPDGRLTIATIMEKPLPHGALAVLFACQTATGDANVPDEAMSLGASLLYSGYRSVVATMWKMRDEDGPVIAEAFYKELSPRGYRSRPGALPDISKSAYALAVAVKKLRSQNVEFRRWVPFIHLGK